MILSPVWTMSVQLSKIPKTRYNGCLWESFVPTNNVSAMLLLQILDILCSHHKMFADLLLAKIGAHLVQTLSFCISLSCFKWPIIKSLCTLFLIEVPALKERSWMVNFCSKSLKNCFKNKFFFGHWRQGKCLNICTKALSFSFALKCC